MKYLLTLAMLLNIKLYSGKELLNHYCWQFNSTTYVEVPKQVELK